MAFSAHWKTSPDFLIPDQRDTAFTIEGSAKRYVIDWGDGTTSIAKPFSDSDGDGLKEIDSSHGYADGTYKVSISQGGRSQPAFGWQVIWAEHATTNLDLRGFGGGDFVRAGAGNDVVYALDGDDILIGGGGNDRLIGGRETAARSDSDELYGGRGQDVLIGGGGDDRLEGGNGVDRLIGGNGADHFVFARALNDNNGGANFDPDRDTVVDFQDGIDKLDFSEWTKYHPTRFIGEEDFHGIKNRGEIRISFDSGSVMVLSGDRDGDGVEDFSVRFVGDHGFAASDFIFS